jgi:arylsulfatase A-like enzyme
MVPSQRQGVSRTALRWIELAAWFGLMTGVAETLFLIFRRYAMGRLIWTSMDMIWLGPLVYVGFFLIPGLVLVALSLVRNDLVTLRRGTFLLGFLGISILNLVFFGGLLHPVAQLLIAVGGAVQLAHWVGRSETRALALVRRTLPWVLAGVMIMAGGAVALRRLQRIHAESTLPGAAPEARNVLLVIWDTVRGESLSLYGYDRPTTPNLERLGQEGAVYERAMSTAPWTLSSHASLFTGRLTQELSTTWHTPLDKTFPTIAEVLADQGYRTGGFVANLIAATRESGLDRGFSHYEDYRFRPSQIMLSTTLGQRIRRLLPFNRGPLRTYAFRPAHQVTDGFLRWVDDDRSRPFFAFLNYFDAHDPYYPPPEWRKRFPPAGTDRNARRMAAYDAAIGYLDHELERLRQELDKRGLLETTLIIVTSDHGELFGEHGLYQHGNSLYLPLLQVPLVMRLPGVVPAGRRFANPVGLDDLPGTILSMVGARPDPRFPGKALEAAWRGADPTTDTVIAGVPKGIGTDPNEPVTVGDMNSVIAGRYQYILNGDGSEDLFDIVADPAEMTNLAGDRAANPLLRTFRAALLSRVPEKWTRALTEPGTAEPPVTE